MWYPVRRIVGRKDALPGAAMRHRGGVADGFEVDVREPLEEVDLAQQTDLLGQGALLRAGQAHAAASNRTIRELEKGATTERPMR